MTDFDRTGKLYPKIDIFYRNGRAGLVYACSTQQWKLCRDAAQSWADIHLGGATHTAKGKRQVVARRA